MENSQSLPESTLNRMDIIFADDDTEEMFIFKNALEELARPYTLRHADNGDSPFVLLKEKIPYLLFLDINMPCEDGVAYISEIRKDRTYDKLPIIVYSGNISPKVVDDCYDQRANLYIQKAYTLNTLTKNLNKVFSFDWHNSLHYPSRDNFVLV